MIKKLSSLVVVLAVLVMVSATIFPVVFGANTNNISSFDKGPSYKSVVPLKKTTFVAFDEDTYIDDYAYLAAVPTAVFDDGDRLFSNPLLFYQDDLDMKDEKEITMDSKKGIDYFMEDWMSYCNGKLDQLTLINVPVREIDSSWNAKETMLINSNNPYEIASDLALSEWSYSDDAVIAVINESFEKSDYRLTNEIKETMPVSELHMEPTFELTQENALNPIFNEFTVGDEYKHLYAEVWWDCIMPIPGVMLPPGDPDVQLYCKYDGDWMQSAAVSYWNVYKPAGHEFVHAYVYNPGSWKIGITDMPTQSEVPRKSIGPLTIQGNLLKALSKGVTYYVEITMYPGIDIEIPDLPPFGCRDVDFELNWDNTNIDLGFSVIGPGGEVVHTVLENEDEDVKEGTKKVHFNQLGECLDGEHYSISVFSLNDVSTPTDFTVEYSWGQNITKIQADALTSATEGAVLASTLNAPLLYTTKSEVPECTKDALYTLGVENIYLVDLGEHASEDVVKDLDRVAQISENYKDHTDIYKAIRKITGSNDVIFTTIDPWTKWYLAELKPGDETEAALFIGPSAYIAAHHGAPVLIVDNHPELSSAVVWHNEFWSRIAGDRYWNDPPVGEMVFTGRRIWDFLELHDFDKVGAETIITVADQYDIGIAWDRIFPGVANSGRICGTPVDTSQWICRSMFYPALIYENPALQGEVNLINGSLSERTPSGILKYPYGNTLTITRESGEENFRYPVLCSFIGNTHRFNERASKYYGAYYECADGLIPGVTPTMESIDQGSIARYTGKEGSYFPDMTPIDIIPFYMDKGEYDVAFSTAMPSVVDNLNQGVILWVHNSHGVEPKGGKTLFWDPQNGFESKGQLSAKIGKIFSPVMKDENPAWVYEWIAGSTEEPDSMGMDIDGRFPFTSIKWPLPATGQDWVVARRPIRELLNRLFFWSGENRPFNVDSAYDGVTSTSLFSRFQTYFYTASEIEENLDNLHSSGFITNICQTSNTYLHMMMVRHGSVFQVQDPWPTSWYSSVWEQSIARDIILGDTVGEAYSKGISHVGTLYLGSGGSVKNDPQWWWDTAENVVYFGDPDLRMFVPGTDYSDANYWEQDDIEPIRYDAELSVDGHMPFGATEYPNEKEPVTLLQEYLGLIVALAIIVVLVIVFVVVSRKKKTNKK